MKSDEMRIKGLEIYANHGVLREERQLGQKFIINCTLKIDLTEAAISHKLDKTINYSKLCHFIKSYVMSHTFALIETLAEKLAREILRNYERVYSVDIEVSKPWAPIELPLNTISIFMSRSRHRVFIALGSNIGNRENYLNEAVSLLNELEDFEVERVSDFIVSKPYGSIEQEDFLNGVLMGKTILSPVELLESLHRIEASQGRTRELRWGPRTLDLDIILYDDLVMSTSDLTIPHPEMHLREFVLRPLQQIAPWVRHPVLDKTPAQLLEHLSHN